MELSFQTPHSASNANSSLDEWKVAPPNAFVSSTATKSQDQHFQRQQERRCYTCGEPNHLSRYCPKHCRDTSKQPEICRNYNRLEKSNCEEDANKCSYGRQHKCQHCYKWGCKAIKHTENRPLSTPRMTSVPSNELNSLRQQLTVLSTRLEKFESQCPEKSASSVVSGSENPGSTLASSLTPVSSDQPATSTPLLGLPAVTIPAYTAKPEALLRQRNIVWTSVTAAGQ